MSEHAKKIAEVVLETRMQTLIYLNKMLFGFKPGKETVDAMLMMWKNAGGISKEGQEVVYVFC